MEGTPLQVSLIVLAAGRSTRFGRPKQTEQVGPKGETIMDITLRDAFDAGCDRAWVVTSPKLVHDLQRRFSSDARVRVLVQKDALGTAHAAMIGLEDAQGTSLVVNGDDLYGASSIRTAVEYARQGDPHESALVAFNLDRTLSPNGPVNRASCSVDGEYLSDTHEVMGLAADDQDHIKDRKGEVYDARTPVSMNLWVLRPAFNALLVEAWRERDGAEPDEFGLPTAVHQAIERGHRFHMLRTHDAWFGLTFPEDAQLVRDHLLSTHGP